MSATDTNKLRARVATLDKLLDDFDGQLDDLLAKSLPETLLGLDTLQQAKLQVTIPYLVYDLVIIYLKTKGIDPRTHSVFRELERVKEYIEKVSKAEKQESQQQRTAIDKAAANRFIKHAIAQAVRTQGQTSEPTDQEPTPGPSKIHVQAQSVPAGATKKMLARAEWEKQVQVAAEEEEEDLEIFEEAEGQAIADADVEMTDDKASAPPLPMRAGETGVLSEQQSATTKKKKKRSKKAKLPLTGSVPTTDTHTGTEGTGFSTNPQIPPQKPETFKTTPEDLSSTTLNTKKRPFPLSATPTGDSGDPAPPSATSSALPKNKKRKRNKKNNHAGSTAGAETDGTVSRPQSQSQSRDVSAASTPQVPAQPLPLAEVDIATAGAAEKPKKRKNSRKKKNVNAVAAESDTQS